MRRRRRPVRAGFAERATVTGHPHERRVVRRRLECYAQHVSNDTKWIIGTTAGTLVVVAGLLSAQIDGQFGAVNRRIDDVNTRFDDVSLRIDDRFDAVNTRIDDLRDRVTSEIARLRADVRGLDTRLRAVEVAVGKVDQRLETLERLHLPGPGAGGG